MPSALLHRTLALALGLMLAACDSGDPDNPPPPPPTSSGLPEELVGTWGVDAQSEDTYIASPTAQIYTQRGFTSTVTGSVRVGDVTIPLRFAEVYPGDTYPSAVYTSYDSREGTPFNERAAQLYVYHQGDGSVVQLTVYQSNGEQRYYSEYFQQQPISSDSPTVSVGPYTLTDYDGNPTITAQASAASPTIALPAGVRTRIEGYRSELGAGPARRPATRYTFDADGGFRLEQDRSLTNTAVSRGTWSVQDGVIRLEFSNGSSANDIQRYTYSLDGERLTLAFVQARCAAGEPDAAGCLESQAQRGELSAPLSLFEHVTSFEMTPTEAPFLRQEDPASVAKSSAASH